jgi:hypothetical protein
MQAQAIQHNEIRKKKQTQRQREVNYTKKSEHHVDKPHDVMDYYVSLLDYSTALAMSSAYFICTSELSLHVTAALLAVSTSRTLWQSTPQTH